MEWLIILFLFLTILKLCTSYTTLTCTTDIANLLANMYTYDYPEPYETFRRDTFENGGSLGYYDIIIVGAGSSGCVLAERLTENNCFRVLVLEAGVEPLPVSLIPFAAGLLQFSQMNYDFKSTPQKSGCQGMVENRCMYPRGRAFGGSSSINYLIYTRANCKQYNKMSKELNGENVWDFENVLAYSKKAEHFTTDRSLIDEEYHNYYGPLYTQTTPNYNEGGTSFLNAVVERGESICDYNGADQLCYGRTQSTSKEGNRFSTYLAYLKPAETRTNLKIVKNAFVTKAIIDPITKIAKGVEFVVGSKKYIAEASKEVILSAGAIGSPQILMLSGVGPKQHLEDNNIPVIKNLPVGEKLMDHPFTLLLASSNYTTNRNETLLQWCEKFTHGTGFLTTAGDIQTLGFENFCTLSTTVPNIEIFILPSFDISNLWLKYAFRIRDDIFLDLINEFPVNILDLSNSSPVYATVFIIVNIGARSRGSVSLRSEDPFESPDIDPNFYDDPFDMDVMIKGIKFVERLVETNALKKYKVNLKHRLFQQCYNFPCSSDTYLQCYLNFTTTSIYHPMGTCRMGNPTDSIAVVDKNLEVIGVENLRVVDASTFNNNMRCHTNFPTIVQAEVISDVIKQKYKACPVDSLPDVSGILLNSKECPCCKNAFIENYEECNIN